MNQLPRIIPALLLKNAGLIKTVQFRDPKYVGDPLNAVKIFNEKEVDELIFLDIAASNEKKRPPFNLISQIASECFMPLCYGGGIRTIEDIKTIISSGVEKVAINSYAVENPAFIREAANLYGSSTIVVSIDVKKNFWGKHEIYSHGGKKRGKIDPVRFAVQMNEMGAGELLVNSIDRDGTMQGFDIDLLKRITKEVDVPVIACGGAGNMSDLVSSVKEGGASAVAAGSIFVFHGKHKAVLINYPSQKELKQAFFTN